MTGTSTPCGTREARSDPALNRIVRNGLAAYAVFQAWGNNPDGFRSGKGLALLDALSKPATGGGAVPVALTDPPDPTVATLLDVGSDDLAECGSGPVGLDP